MQLSGNVQRRYMIWWNFFLLRSRSMYVHTRFKPWYELASLMYVLLRYLMLSNRKTASETSMWRSCSFLLPPSCHSLHELHPKAALILPSLFLEFFLGSYSVRSSFAQCRCYGWNCQQRTYQRVLEWVWYRYFKQEKGIWEFQVLYVRWLERYQFARIFE